MSVPGVAQRGRGNPYPALALTLVLTALAACGVPASVSAPGWVKVGEADRQGYIVEVDRAGCYWLDGGYGISALKRGDHQWCAPPPPTGTPAKTPDQTGEPK